MFEFNENGKVTYHYSELTGYEEWFDYNDEGDLIHTKDSNGYERWYEYSYKDNLKCIHFKNSEGREYWAEYDIIEKDIVMFKDLDGIDYDEIMNLKWRMEAQYNNA